MIAKQKTELLTPNQAAEYLGVKAQTLAVWRSTGRYGLRFIKVGKRVQYSLADLDSFLDANTMTHTGEAN